MEITSIELSIGRVDRTRESQVTVGLDKSTKSHTGYGKHGMAVGGRMVA